MAQEIYNEGRIVGLSAWEIFAKNAEANGVLPEDIPTESQCLTAMIGAGASMILRVSAGTTKGIHDYDLPVGSNLSAAGVIIANPFLGECKWDSATWATTVKSYSPLILNNTTDYPTSSDVPFDENYSGTAYNLMVSEFAKITDGIVFTKTAQWVDAKTQSADPPELPKKDINPDFNNSSTTVRLYVSADIDYDVTILLTGFQNKRILQGLSSFAASDGSCGSCDIDNNDWINGGLLGPEVIPWASKIVFSVPSSLYNSANSMNRTIPANPTYTIPSGGLDIDGITIKENSIDGDIRANSFIDFNSIVLTDYYDQHQYSTSPTLNDYVNTVGFGAGDSTNALVAWYPGMTAAQIQEEIDASTPSNVNFFPPALYAAQITSEGLQTLVPIDTAAPGTVKGFEDPDQASAYKELLPNNYAIYHNSTNNTFSFVTGTNPNEWSGTAKVEYLSQAPKAKITAGSTEAKFIALTKVQSGNVVDYDTTGASGAYTSGPNQYVVWSDMLNALAQGKKIDVLGGKTYNLASDLQSTNKIGIASGHEIDEIGSKKFTVKDGNKTVNMTVNSNNLATFSNGVRSGTNFIEFSNGKRLYIETDSTKVPTSGVPVGSIGIGW